MIFTKYLNDFWHKRKMYNFEPYCVLLVIATIYLCCLRLLLCSRVTNTMRNGLRSESNCFLSSVTWRTEALNQFVHHGIRYAAILAHFESD